MRSKNSRTDGTLEVSRRCQHLVHYWLWQIIPDAADSVAAMAAIERTDQSMIVIERPMLVAMPNFSQHMIYVDEENPARFGLMRSVIQRLKDGKTVIMFPRGNLEPDPGLDSLVRLNRSTIGRIALVFS